MFLFSTEIFSCFLPNFENPQKNIAKNGFGSISRFGAFFCSFDPQIYCLRALHTLPPSFLQPIWSISHESEGLLRCSSAHIFAQFSDLEFLRRAVLPGTFRPSGTTGFEAVLLGERYYRPERGTTGLSAVLLAHTVSKNHFSLLFV